MLYAKAKEESITLLFPFHPLPGARLFFSIERTGNWIGLDGDDSAYHGQESISGEMEMEHRTGLIYIRQASLLLLSTAG